MRETTHCDWCLRPQAPQEWESATTDEQRDGYCWGEGDARCDELHGEEWGRLREEVARLRGQLADIHAVETARSEGCACGDDEACRFVRERDEARAEVARLRGLLGEAIEGLQEFVCDDEQATEPGDGEYLWVLREQLAAAREEIATLRVALGTLPAVQVLSPLAMYPVAVAVGEPYPVCARCQRLAADCSCQPPLICPACGCAWPELTPGTEDTVTCACGRVLGCTRRGR